MLLQLKLLREVARDAAGYCRCELPLLTAIVLS
jgi:hypothetical protein